MRQFTSTLGLVQVSAVGRKAERCFGADAMGDGSVGGDSTCATSSVFVVHDLISWFIVDTVASLFLHPSFRAHVDAWAAARSALSARTAAAALLLSARRRAMHAWRLRVWRQLRRLELETILARLKAIQQKLGHATPQGGESGGAGEEVKQGGGKRAEQGGGKQAERGGDKEAKRGGTEEEERSSALTHATRRLVAVGFARGNAELSLRACGAAGSTRDSLGTAVLLRALTLLIELQLGLVPRARVVRMASTATTAAAVATAAATAATAAAAASAADAEAPSGAAVAVGSGGKARAGQVPAAASRLSASVVSGEARGRGKGKGKGKPKDAWCWRAASDGAAWVRRQLLLLREPAVVLATLSLSREAAGRRASAAGRIRQDQYVAVRARQGETCHWLLACRRMSLQRPAAWGC